MSFAAVEISRTLYADANNNAAVDSKHSTSHDEEAASDSDEEQEDSDLCMDMKADQQRISPPKRTLVIKNQYPTSRTPRERPLRAARLRLGRSALKEAEVRMIHSKLLEVEDNPPFVRWASEEEETKDDIMNSEEESEVTDSENTALTANCGKSSSRQQHTTPLQRHDRDLVASLLQQVSCGHRMHTQMTIPASTLKAFPLSERAMQIILRSHELDEKGEEEEDDDDSSEEEASATPARAAVKTMQPVSDKTEEYLQHKQEDQHDNDNDSVELQPSLENWKSSSSSYPSSNSTKHMDLFGFLDASSSLCFLDPSDAYDEHSRFPWWQIIVCVLLLIYLWNFDQSKSQALGL